MKSYQIQKILSNNIVQCQILGEAEECIVQGKGIGFGKKSGDLVDPEKIEKTYFMKDQKKIRQYSKLVETCDQRVVEAVEEIIRRMEERFGNVYDEYVHIALLDHLNFAVYRYHNHIEINNIFLDEYRLMYAKEYAFAKEMVAYFDKCLHIELPESEIGFITLHFHSALHKERISKTNFYMQIITVCIDCIERHLHEHLDSGSIERMRLITHLKFAFERANHSIVLENPILERLKVQYPNMYEIALDMANLVEEQFGIHLPEGELGYLVLHIQNIVMTLHKQREE